MKLDYLRLSSRGFEAVRTPLIWYLVGIGLAKKTWLAG
jgi:hypothetical protein